MGPGVRLGAVVPARGHVEAAGFGTESAQVCGSWAGRLERMFAAVDRVVDEALEVRREGRRRRLGVDLRGAGAACAAGHADRARGR